MIHTLHVSKSIYYCVHNEGKYKLSDYMEIHYIPQRTQKMHSTVYVEFGGGGGGAGGSLTYG